MPSLPTTKFDVSVLFVSNNVNVKVYPANYPAVISDRSRIWPDSEKWPDIRLEPELNSDVTLFIIQNIYCCVEYTIL
jgi:hypothetical protein